MNETQVTIWFGDAFDQLQPGLQSLHRSGGRLDGTVTVATGKGPAGLIGRRLARRLGIPGPGPVRLRVDILHDADGLHWNRRFGDGHWFRSLFRPVGHWPDGHWLESAGPFELRLGVEIMDGGWHWRQRGLRWQGLPIPARLAPRMEAWKRIENGRYRFHVHFRYPLLGTLLSYDGLLDLAAG